MIFDQFGLTKWDSDRVPKDFDRGFKDLLFWESMETNCQQLANNYIRTDINPCQIRSKFYESDREFRLK